MAGDSKYGQVAHLLQGNSFDDASSFGHTFYHRNVTVEKVSDTAVPYFFFASLAEQPVLYTPSDDSTRIGYNQDFTIELDANPSAYPYGAALFSNRDAAGNGILLGLTAMGQLFATITIAGNTRFSYTAPQRHSKNALFTIALQRANGTLSLYCDGVNQSMATINAFLPAAIPCGQNVYIGGDTIISPFNGYIRRYRFTRAMRYSENYVPGVLEYPSFDDSSNPVSIIGVNPTHVPVATGLTLAIQAVNAVSLKAQVEDLYGNVLPGVTVNLVKNTNASWQAAVSAIPYTGRVYLSLIGYNGTVYTGESFAKRIPIYVTATGAVDAFEEAIFNIGPCVSWVDFSDPNTLTLDGGNVVKVNDKASFTALDATNKLLSAYTVAPFSKGGLAFSNASQAALVYETPVTCASAVTLITVFAYSGTQVGQGKGGLFINDTGNNNGKGFKATAVSSGSDYIDITEVSSLGQLFQVPDTIAPASKYVVAVAMDDQSAPVLYINQVKIALPSAQLLKEVLTVAYIGSLDSGYKNLATVASVIIYNGRIAESYIKSISGNLNTLLNVYTPKPYSMPPSPSTGIVGEVYTGTLSVYNSSTASISASDGSPWIISRVSGSTFSVTGRLPNAVMPFSITVTASNGVDQDVSTFPIVLQVDDTTPVIYRPDTLLCDAGLPYYGQVRISKADSASISCTSGNAWTITRIGGTEYWVITGVAGNTSGTFKLAITATNSASGSSLKSQFDFKVDAIDYSPHVLPVNTGHTGLERYVVENEPFFYQKENGIQINVISFKGGPFREDGFLMEAFENGAWRTAFVGRDYVFHGPLTEIKQHTGVSFYKAIRLINPLLPNTLRASYTRMGGVAGMDYGQMLESVSNYLVNDRVPGSGAVITGMPNNLPIAKHTHRMSDIRGFGDLYAALYWMSIQTSQAHANGEYATANVHRGRTDFPHAYKKADAGLSNIQNYPPATPATTVPSNSTSYMTVECAYKMTTAGTSAGQATTSIYGVMLLNNNVFAGDATDATKGLTYAGLLDMLAKDSAYLSTLYSDCVPVQITPWPPVYPCYFKGYRAENQQMLFNILETFYRQGNINVRTDIGVAYLPHSIAALNAVIALDSNSAYTGQRGFTPSSVICAPFNRLT